VRIAPIYGAICAVMLVALAARVARMRVTYRVGLGSGTERRLERAIRVHGNFAENVPIALLLLVLAELQGAPAWLLHALGASLVAGRILHAQGLTRSSGASFGRFVGTSLTWTTLLVNAGVCVWRAIGP
jgi:uncharacterized membrane protein YecN with MAPEG domain